MGSSDPPRSCACTAIASKSATMVASTTISVSISAWTTGSTAGVPCGMSAKTGATAKTFLRIAPPWLTKAGEAAGAAGYVLIGCLGVLAGKKFLENVLPLGTPGNAWSSGTILFLNMTVGLAVAAGFVELLSVFVEEVLRRET